MLRIECVYCGVRDEEEFKFGGPAHVRRPDGSCSDAEWARYLFHRDNPKGVHYERWCHTFGCGRWFNIARNTVTHEVLGVYRMGESKPDLGAIEDAASARREGVLAASTDQEGFTGRLADEGAGR